MAGKTTPEGAAVTTKVVIAVACFTWIQQGSMQLSFATTVKMLHWYILVVFLKH